MLHRWGLALLFFIFSLGFSATSVKAQYLPSSIAEITRTADVIIIGTVENIESTYDIKHRTIFTYATVTVEEEIKNFTPIKNRKKIVVRTEGGIAEGREIISFDLPKFDLNEKVFLFLSVDTGVDPRVSEGDRLGDFVVTQFESGKFTISDSLVQIRDDKNDIHGKMDLGNLVNDIKKIMTGSTDKPSYMNPQNLQ